MLQIMTFLIFLIISQAPIFAHVKPIDFNRKNRMPYSTPAKKDSKEAEFKRYPSNKICFKPITFKKIEFNNNVGKRLIGQEASIKGPIDSDNFLRLLNKYQSRPNLDNKPEKLIARISDCTFN